MQIASMAWKFFFPLLIISAIFFGIGWWTIGSAILLLSLGVLYFFRDPERIPPDVADAVVAPADGKLDTIEIVPHTGFPDGKALKVGIFLSIFDVHINRAPYTGEVVNMQHQSGQFINAMDKDSSSLNECNLIELKTRAGPVFVKQIAGLVARRIVCTLKKGERIEMGQRIGLICFGSRTETFFPSRTKLKVEAGMKVRAGSTLIGILEPDIKGTTSL
jgi:phosphatidylserine decarboxylase